MTLTRQQAILIFIAVALLGALVVLAGAAGPTASDIPNWVEETLGPRNPELICLRIERWSEEMREEMRDTSPAFAKEKAIKIARALLATYDFPSSVFEGARPCELRDRSLDLGNGQEVMRSIVSVLLGGGASPEDMSQTERSLRLILLDRSIRPEIREVCGLIERGELQIERGRRYISALVTAAIERWGFRAGDFQSDTKCRLPARSKS